MKLFDQSLRTRSKHHGEIVQLYEFLRTFIEFLAAVCFVVGSIFFFSPAWVYTGTWLFLVGSVFFAVRPTVRLLLEFHLTRLPVAEVHHS